MLDDFLKVVFLLRTLFSIFGNLKAVLCTASRYERCCRQSNRVMCFFLEVSLPKTFYSSIKLSCGCNTTAKPHRQCHCRRSERSLFRSIAKRPTLLLNVHLKTKNRYRTNSCFSLNSVAAP